MKTEKKVKIKASELREIQILSSVIPAYKAMGFRVDSKINSLSAEAKAIIEYNIGDQLKPIKESLEKISNEIRTPFIEDFKGESEGLNTEETKALGKLYDGKINKALLENKEFKDLKKQEEDLWETEIAHDLKVIEIEEKEYSEKFQESKPVDFNGRQLLIDGYQALLQLITKGIIRVIEPTEESEKRESIMEKLNSKLNNK